VAATWHGFVERGADLPKNQPKAQTFAAKKPHPVDAMRNERLSSGIPADFDDNTIN
jgi:hypothetical protein